MPKIDSTFTTLGFAAMVALMIGAFVHYAPGNQRQASADRGSTDQTPVSAKSQPGTSAIETGTTRSAGEQPAAAKAAIAPASPWTASAPGRIESRSGEVRVIAAQAGRIERVLVEANDKVRAGDPLVVLDDRDHRARLVAAELEVSVRRRERDGEPTNNRLATDRRTAEDALAAAELALHRAQLDFDDAMIKPKSQVPAADEAARLRAAIETARVKREEEADKLRKVVAQPNLPLATRLESSLALARAELRLAELALDRTRVRAPIDGSVLQVHALAGELAAPSPELAPLAVLGDLTGLRVRAEVDERDTARIRVGQDVVVRATAFPGQDFTGKVQRIAPTIAAPRIANRGARRATDVEVLEVVVELDGLPPLLPGMRVDVFFKAEVPPSPSVAGSAVQATR